MWGRIPSAAAGESNRRTGSGRCVNRCIRGCWAKIRVIMTFRISQFRAACGLGLLVLPVAVLAQAPRYQSPIGAPNAPQPQVAFPVPAAITPNGTVVEDTIVRVNDQIVTRS